MHYLLPEAWEEKKKKEKMLRDSFLPVALQFFGHIKILPA